MVACVVISTLKMAAAGSSETLVMNYHECYNTDNIRIFVVLKIPYLLPAASRGTCVSVCVLPRGRITPISALLLLLLLLLLIADAYRWRLLYKFYIFMLRPFLSVLQNLN